MQSNNAKCIISWKKIEPLGFLEVSNLEEFNMAAPHLWKQTIQTQHKHPAQSIQYLGQNTDSGCVQQYKCVKVNKVNYRSFKMPKKSFLQFSWLTANLRVLISPSGPELFNYLTLHKAFSFTSSLTLMVSIC